MTFSKIRKNLTICLGGVMLALGYSAGAHAYSCVTTTLTNNDGCEAGSFVFDTPGNIAIDNPFGVTDWIGLDTSNDGGLDDLELGFRLFTTGTDSGAWIISFDGLNPWDVYADLMITLQGGLGNYVAYSLVPTDTAGAYQINGAADLDHARLWGTPATAVPAPAGLWLLGAGLVGMFGARRRRDI